MCDTEIRAQHGVLDILTIGGFFSVVSGKRRISLAGGKKTTLGLELGSSSSKEHQEAKVMNH